MADAQLAATVYVTDPDTHQQVRLEPGTCPEPRLAALVKAKGAWIDGKRPDLPEEGEADSRQPDAASEPGDGTPAADSKAAPAAKKTAARKTAAASKPARGRDAAAEGGSGD